MEDELDIDELRKLKVVELRERLSELGLPTGGLKADLVERLFTHLRENAEGEEAEEEEEIEEDNEDGEDSPPPLSPEPQQFLQHEDQHQAPPQQQHQMRHMQPPQAPPPPGVRPPSGPPPFAAPPQFGHPRGMPPPPPHMQQQGPLDELQQKVALQNKMIAEEKEQQMKQQQQQLLEQQQKIMQQQQQILRQQQQQGLPPGPPRDVELMEKVRQQQLMIEHEKHQELLREQQTKLLETQKQALQKMEEERRQREEEMLRQQQIAVMEAQMEEQQKRQQQQQHPPGGMQPPMPMGMGQPPVGMGPMPTPPRPQGSIPGGPPPTSAPPGMMPAPGGMMQGPPRPGMQQMMPPQSSGGSNMPPQMMPAMPSPAPSHPHPPGPPPQMSRPQPPPQAQPPHQQQMRLRGPAPQTHGPRPTAPGGPPRNQAPGGPPQSPDDEDEERKEIRLPHALEKILAFKDVRAQEVGLTKEELEELDKPEVEPTREDDDEIEMEMDDIEEDTEKMPDQTKAKESKNKKRKKKKKKTKRNHQQQEHQKKPAQEKNPEEDVQIEYIHEQLDLDPMDPNYFTFARIFEAFKISEPELSKENEKKETEKKEEEKKGTTIPIKARGLYEDDDDVEDEDDDNEKKPEDDTEKISKKKLKKLTRLSVAQLKQLVSRPDVVEMHDVTAQDPRLLVHLKATRNTVPVPRHWCFKRKYLQGKRGIEKPPFDLPDYIKDTGIMEMRAALQEKEDQKNLKAKMREKVRPKMGKIDIDYQKLHDAFFRHQNKPKMTVHGDLYYEGKEFETKLKEKKPGNLSDDLRTALGMPIGPGAEKVPPPWLIAMQRYGPPPSYPNLKIPGLNGAIPEGCSFGYHAGGWGKPPVDENGKPLYGDVFGTQSAEFQMPVQEEEIDRTHWGEVESESEEEESSEEESEGEEDEMGLVTPAEGMVTPSGITSVPIGMETPDMIELRKKRIEDIMDQGGETPALYTILPEKKTTVGGAMMGSAHIYDISAVTGVPQAKKPGEKVTEGIEVALNPEELDLDTAAMQAKYDQTLREQQSQLEKEDLSDMVAEHAAKQKKRKKQLQDSGKGAKKYREFKF
ncbi:hypothetical protein CHS0354_042705 [Potamilus streckersoni]|uniref:SAP domain-containing protein n=1 Tax=Potamilus streckersoni TaxID=2493646 RepID=A0AAE0S9C8_9BIVA|nr:hypothetical protein CHS0354_042705 [Potamilus streckersoni]